MACIILFDLDDTLLSNKIEVFIPAYIRALSSSIHQVLPDTFSSALIQASQAMTNKNGPSSTLENTFDNHFYPSIGVSKQKLESQISNFYQKDYPNLKNKTQQFPGIVPIIKKLLDSGHKIVIATNPLFPLTAIEQRLDWAGFGEIKKDFSLITSFETFHYAKPHPEYYAEILSKLGWPDQPAVMVGNSLDDDILPADDIGLPTFHFNKINQLSEKKIKHPMSMTGDHSLISSWVDRIELSSDYHSLNLTRIGLISALTVTPGLFESFHLQNSFDGQRISFLQKAIAADLEFLQETRPEIYLDLDFDRLFQFYMIIRQRLLTLINHKDNSIDPNIVFASDKQLIKELLNSR